MIDITVSDTQLAQWQLTIETLCSSCGGDFFLFYLNSAAQLQLLLQSSSSDTVDLLPVQAAADQSLAQLSTTSVHADYSSPIVIDGIQVLPLFWPSKALYGGLFWQPAKADAIGLSSGVKSKCSRLLPLGRDSIELSLLKCYQAHQQPMRGRATPAAAESIDLQLFIDSIKDHIWMKDGDGRYILVNHGAELSFNKSREQILYHTDDELFEPRLAKRFIAADNESILRGIQVTVDECLARDHDKQQSWLETTKMPVVSAEGELKGVIGISRNISSHKAAQEQLEMAASVFANSVEGVVITDPDGNIVEVHGAFTDITGYRRDEVIGKNPRLFNSGRHDKAFFAQLWDSLLSEGCWHGEIWNRRKSGAIFPEQLSISSMCDDDNNIRYFVAVFSDISAKKQSENELARLVYHDPLTQMPNRITLSAQLEQEVRHAKREQSQLALIFIDVDLFKHINDSFGHIAGDSILVELAKRLSYKLAEQGTLARVGSDEFVVLLPHIDSQDAVSLMVSRLREVFDLPYALPNDETVRLTASMGIAQYPEDGLSSDTLLRNADTAMHRAKLNGRNNYAFYTQALTLASVEHLKLQNALHDALANEAFQLVYQPKLSFNGLHLVGFEALLRWHDPLLGAISPAIFIPVAEKIGLIYDIGLWVLKTAASQGVKWLAQGQDFGRIAVNVAGPQLQQASFFDDVKRILEQTGLPAHYVELEVTESCMMSDPKAVIEVLKKLGDLGIELSVDDFGTGYSSLNYLKRLPIHKLKIDQSFVHDIPHDANNTAIAKAIIALGDALNLTVIAEGVETQEQAEFLSKAGCHEAQGYLYSKPLPASELDRFLMLAP